MFLSSADRAWPFKVPPHSWLSQGVCWDTGGLFPSFLLKQKNDVKYFTFFKLKTIIGYLLEEMQSNFNGFVYRGVESYESSFFF